MSRYSAHMYEHKGKYVSVTELKTFVRDIEYNMANGTVPTQSDLQLFKDLMERAINTIQMQERNFHH